MTRLPLHYQILIALIAGTVIGLLVNPGDAPLDDARIDLTFTVKPVGDEGLAMTVEGLGGMERLEKSFANIRELQAARPKLAKRMLMQRQEQQLVLGVFVSDRRVHFTEDGKKISVNYTRLHDGKPIATTDVVSDASDLAERFPQWAKVYAGHGGGWRSQITIGAKFVGDLFLRLLKMITIPLIVTSLVTGVAGLGNTSRFGAMFGKTLLYYLVTSMLAITTGLLMVNLIRPGIGADLPGGSEAVVAGAEKTLGGILTDLLNNMIPPNPIQSLAGAEFLSIITFSILIGIFIIHIGGQSAETLRKFFQAGFDVMMGMTMFIIRLAPIGVFAFMLFATASQGLDIFKTLAWYMLTVFLALLIHAAVVLPLIVKFVARRSPIAHAKAMSPALMTAFSTASSNGTLPLTLTSVEERAGISNRISSFVLPLGATINMDGTALYEAVAVLFIAQAYHGHVPIESQILVAITALLASVGAAGIPHAGLVMMAIVLQAVDLPVDAQGIIIAVDRVLDMCRTSVNVWSDSCGCAVLARFEGPDDSSGGTTAGA